MNKKRDRFSAILTYEVALWHMLLCHQHWQSYLWWLAMGWQDGLQAGLKFLFGLIFRLTRMTGGGWALLWGRALRSITDLKEQSLWGSFSTVVSGQEVPEKSEEMLACQPAYLRLPVA